MLTSEILAVLNFGYAEISSTETAGTNNYTLDATSDEIAITCFATKAQGIDQIGLWVSAVNGSPTYTLQIEGVDSSGNPDGTVKSSATVQWSPTSTGWNYITLGATHTVARGDLICLRILDGTTGTNPDGANNISISAQSAQYQTNSIPYLMFSTDTGATWTKVQEVRPLFAFRNSGATTDVIGYPIDPTTYNAQPTELANAAGEISAQKIKISPKFGKRVRVAGIELRHAVPLGNSDIGIYDANGEEVAAVTYNSNHAGTAASNYQVFFTTSVWLNTDTSYYVGMKFGAVLCWVYVYDLPNATDRAAFPGYPDNSYSHWNGLAWGDQTDAITHGISLFIDDWDKTTDGIQTIGGVKA